MEPEPRPDRSRSRQAATILLCEDEETILRSMQRILAADGYSVLAAPSAEAALDLAARHPGRIDLLVTDVGLEGRSGADLAREVRTARPEIAVLYASGNEAEDIDAGDDAPWSFLEKPFKPDALLRSVAAALERSGR